MNHLKIKLVLLGVSLVSLNRMIADELRGTEENIYSSVRLCSTILGRTDSDEF